MALYVKEKFNAIFINPKCKTTRECIDVYLEPIDVGLKELWHNRVAAYDAFSKTTSIYDSF